MSRPIDVYVQARRIKSAGLKVAVALGECHKDDSPYPIGEKCLHCPLYVVPSDYSRRFCAVNALDALAAFVRGDTSAARYF